MTSDISGGTRTFGVHGTSEVRALFKRETPGDDVGFDGGVRPDVDALRGDVTFEMSIDRDGPRLYRRSNARPRARHEIVSLEIDRPLEETVNHHVFARREFALDRECRAAAHGLYFRPLTGV
jgi:hypothetical protein